MDIIDLVSFFINILIITFILGYGMCGFSAAIPGLGDKRLFISAPGVWYWQGSVFSQSVSNITDRPNTSDGPAHTDHHQLGIFLNII